MKFGKYETAIVVFVSFCLAIGLGLMDYKTESLWHLFTAESGNLVILVVYTLFFSCIGFGGIRLVKGHIKYD